MSFYDDVSMNGSNGEGSTAIVALSARDPIVTRPGDREGPSEEHPDRRFYMGAPEVHWHYHAAPTVQTTADGEARRAIDRLADEAFRFGRQVEHHQVLLHDSVLRAEAECDKIRALIQDVDTRMSRVSYDAFDLLAAPLASVED